MILVSFSIAIPHHDAEPDTVRSGSEKILVLRVNQGTGRDVAIGMRNYLADASRGLAAAGVLLSAVVHLDQYEAGFRDVATIGPLFLLNFAGGLVIGVGVLVWRHWLPTLLAAGFGAATVVAYWISVVHGLFGVKEVIGGWAEILAQTAEYAAIVFGLAATVLLAPQRGPTRALQPPERFRTKLLR